MLTCPSWYADSDWPCYQLGILMKLFLTSSYFLWRLIRLGWCCTLSPFLCYQIICQGAYRAAAAVCLLHHLAAGPGASPLSSRSSHTLGTSPCHSSRLCPGGGNTAGTAATVTPLPPPAADGAGVWCPLLCWALQRWVRISPFKPRKNPARRAPFLPLVQGRCCEVKRLAEITQLQRAGQGERGEQDSFLQGYLHWTEPWAGPADLKATPPDEGTG